MPSPTKLLFVYGTLLSADTGTTGRAQRALLALEARVIGEASLLGRLYDLGRYPALVIDEDVATVPSRAETVEALVSPRPNPKRAVHRMSPPPRGKDFGVEEIWKVDARELAGERAHWVHGELLELADPTHSLARLDAYEGIVPGRHPHNDYERIERTITLTDGTTASAGVYVWRKALQTATLIPGGRWLSR